MGLRLRVFGLGSKGSVFRGLGFRVWRPGFGLGSSRMRIVRSIMLELPLCERSRRVDGVGRLSAQEDLGGTSCWSEFWGEYENRACASIMQRIELSLLQQVTHAENGDLQRNECATLRPT